MIYSCDYTTRWHDADPDGNLRPGAILTYFEETSGLQMRQMGKSLDDLRKSEGLAFILSRIRIVFHRPVAPYRSVRVDTYTTEGSAFISPRYFSMEENGQTVAQAESLWALVDINARTPVKISRFDFGAEFHEPEPREIPTLRIRLPKDGLWEKAGERTIRYSDIDYNGHMNNTKYPDMLCDFLSPEERRSIKEMTLSFLREATLGQTYGINICRPSNNEIYIRTTDEEGQVHLEAQILL